ncbi:MAG TPA: hypothetical protein VHV83_03840, partial [Armatimonadota bacterium]|nr:hypothetical protein [Armatimonadota bacterium]
MMTCFRKQFTLSMLLTGMLMLLLPIVCLGAEPTVRVPSVPVLLTPTAGTVTVSVSPRFTWATAERA